jgi:hypothetical protein
MKVVAQIHASSARTGRWTSAGVRKYLAPSLGVRTEEEVSEAVQFPSAVLWPDVNWNV